MKPRPYPGSPERVDRTTSAGIFKNMTYHHGTNTVVYERHPRVEDINPSSRLGSFMLSMFFHDAVANRMV